MNNHVFIKKAGIKKIILLVLIDLFPGASEGQGAGGERGAPHDGGQSNLKKYFFFGGGEGVMIRVHLPKLKSRGKGFRVLISRQISAFRYFCGY